MPLEQLLKIEFIDGIHIAKLVQCNMVTVVIHDICAGVFNAIGNIVIVLGRKGGGNTFCHDDGKKCGGADIGADISGVSGGVDGDQGVQGGRYAAVRGKHCHIAAVVLGKKMLIVGFTGGAVKVDPCLLYTSRNRGTGALRTTFYRRGGTWGL